MTITNSIFIVSKSYIDILLNIKSEISPCVEIINATGSFEDFIQSFAGHSSPVIDPLLHVSRIAFLVVGDIRGETYFIGNPSPKSQASCIQEKALIVILFFGNNILEDRVEDQLEVFYMNFIK